MDGDFAVDADNAWADPAVVDAHVHAGWMEDYLFKQVSAGRASTTDAARPSARRFTAAWLDNAAFIAPPFRRRRGARHVRLRPHGRRARR